MSSLTIISPGCSHSNILLLYVTPTAATAPRGTVQKMVSLTDPSPPAVAAFDTFSGGIGVDSSTGGLTKLSGTHGFNAYARTSQPITSLSFGCASQSGGNLCNCRFGLVSSTFINSVLPDMEDKAFATWLQYSGTGETVLEEGLSTRSGHDTIGPWAAYPSMTGKIMVSEGDVLFYWNDVLLRTASGAAVGKTFYGSMTVSQMDAVARTVSTHH